MAEIDEGVAGHGEGELSLADGFAFDGGDEEGAGIEDGDEGGEPRLVVVLGAVVAEEGVGNVGFEELGGPAFPLDEEGDEGELAAFIAVAAEELGGGWGGAGAAVQEGYGGFAAGEGLVEDGNEADDECDEAEAGAGFEDEEGAGEMGFGDDVAEAEGEERSAADVEAGAGIADEGVGGVEAVGEGCAEGEVNEGEADDEHGGPDDEQQEERKGAEDAVELVADTLLLEGFSERDPGAPGEKVEEAGEAEAAFGTAREDDGLESVDNDAEAEHEAEDEGYDMHESGTWMRPECSWIRTGKVVFSRRHSGES